jgi:hypothetical protein
MKGHKVKRILFFILAGAVFALLLVAETPAPAIPDAMKLKFFEAQAALQRAQAEYQQAVTQLNTVCGQNFQPQLSKTGDLECVPKPKAK